MTEQVEMRGRRTGGGLRVARLSGAVFLTVVAAGFVFPASTAIPPFFGSDFENGGLGAFVNVQADSSDRVRVVDDTAFTGRRSARFEVQPGDEAAEGNRAEVTGPEFEEGQTVWFRQAIRLPEDSPLDGEWQEVVQYSTNGEGSPAVALFTEADEADGPYRLVLGKGDSSEIFWRSPALEREAWHDVGVMVHFSPTDDGRVRLYFDGKPQTLENGEQEVSATTFEFGRAYYKTGIYRSPTFSGTSFVYHDSILMGDTAEAVGL
jgi:hypothetical protein